MNTLREKFARRRLAAAVAVLTAASPCAAVAQNIRGSASGPTTARGYDHPGQYLHLQDVKPADNMYPVVPHPEQDATARKKLAALEQKTGKKPNVLIFLMDDVGWMDPGFNGGGESVGNATPVMDRLANAGLIFTSAYSTPSSSPSRATLMTGQNPLHHGILIPPMYGMPGGLDGAITLPTLLKKLGYVTQGVGKWHVGENEASLPQNVGFDDYVGFLGVSDMYTEWRDEYFNPEVTLSPARFAMMEKDPFSHNEVHCTTANKTTCENGRLIDLTYIKDLDQHWMETGLAFLDKMKGSKQPFFLYYATRGCHFDNYPSDEWAGKSMSRTSYGDCMVQMDYVLGQLYDKLQQIGELENTLIILSSDNGPECEIPPHARTPFRGCKGSSWEGGVRVPTFAYWKGMINPRRDDGLFDFADILPTVMSLAGVPGANLAASFPKTTYIDGVDQASWIVAEDGHSARRSRPYTMNQYLTAMRIDEFKYMITVQIENGIFQRGDWGGFTGAIVSDTGGSTMVNLYTNPQEDVSVGIRHIPMMTPVGNSLATYMLELLKYPPRFKVGFMSNNPPLYILEPEMKFQKEGAGVTPPKK